MKEFNKIKINISIVNVVFSILIITSLLLILFYIIGDLSEKWAPVVGGAVVASVTASFQYLIAYLDYRNNERLSISGVVNFLTSRDDKVYYSELISKSKLQLDCLFYTSKRFCDDFCTNGAGDNLLIKKLEDNPSLKVRILVQARGFLSEEEQMKYDLAKIKLIEMSAKFLNRFQIKCYSHIPTHNLFLTESDAIIGPYFYNKNGKYNHSIHFIKNADYVDDFKEYFESEWNDAKNYN